MATSVVVPPGLRIGEVLVLILGFAPSTLAVGARIYTKWRIMRKMGLEDCEYFNCNKQLFHG